VTPGIVVIVPVRSIATGKSRLATVLDAPAREAFNEWLLEHTLDTLHAWRGTLASCAVVTPCDRVARIAAARGVHVLRERVDAGLNEAATLGRRHASASGAEKALVLACDLPLLTANALEALVLDAHEADVVIAPDESGTGTNALVLAAVEFEFCFGADSFPRHCAAAASRSLKLEVHRSRALAFDVDTPDDHACWRAISAADALKPMV
jgi:2-phospho-L-lactate guanylyltransferase